MSLRYIVYDQHSGLGVRSGNAQDVETCRLQANGEGLGVALVLADVGMIREREVRIDVVAGLARNALTDVEMFPIQNVIPND